MLGFPSSCGQVQSLLCFDYISCLVHTINHDPLTTNHDPLTTNVQVTQVLIQLYGVISSSLLLLFYCPKPPPPPSPFADFLCLCTRDYLMTVWCVGLHQELSLLLKWNPPSHSSLDVLISFLFSFLLASCDDEMTIWPLTPRWPCVTAAFWSSVMLVLILRKQVCAHVLLLLCCGIAARTAQMSLYKVALLCSKRQIRMEV